MICVYALPLNKTTTKSFLNHLLMNDKITKKVNNPPIVLVCLFPHTISMRSGIFRRNLQTAAC